MKISTPQIQDNHRLQDERQLTYAVIGESMAVHRELGPGLDEAYYHQRLFSKLRFLDLDPAYKPSGRLLHRSIPADDFEADLIVPKRLIIETKTLNGMFAREHVLQLICYLKFWKTRLGLLLDFGKESLLTKRIVFDEIAASSLPIQKLLASAPPYVSDKGLLQKIFQSLDRIVVTHGFGYRDTTYQGLVDADLSAEQVRFYRNPTIQVEVIADRFAPTALSCFVIQETCALMVLALRTSIRAADRSIMQTYLKYLNLPWGFIANFGRSELTFHYVTNSR